MIHACTTASVTGDRPEQFDGGDYAHAGPSDLRNHPAPPPVTPDPVAALLGYGSAWTATWADAGTRRIATLPGAVPRACAPPPA